ncbi:CBU_0592 family membrane protein [Sphingopyxis sp. PET50]|uniref:CBU_0592 family membrane protein n=1 Tax=Sphingopyxis sp. PET50 TaxID=2976533 RepID=UPI0021B03B1C|nr:hypothetical protein [Sphingopyxis sp. PET50]
MTAYVSATAATVIGLFGSAIFLGAFVYANAARTMDPLLFNALNLVGAICLLVSLSVHFNLAAFVLEACWALIAIWGLARALRRRNAAP